MRFLRKLFKRKETPKVNLVVQVDAEFYKGMSNRQMIKKACIEYQSITTAFTSKMIYSYLGGLVSPENTYKQIHALYKLGFLKKVTVLCSDPEANKHKHFYEINKDKK